MSNDNLDLTLEEIDEFKKHQNAIIDKAVDKIMQVHNLEHLGEKARDTMQSGMKFTVETLASIMTVSLPEMIDQQLSWGNDYLPSVGITPQMILTNFEIIKEATGELIANQDYPGVFSWLDLVIKKQREMIK
ncbi:MAG TPA: hypothetical protein VK856_14760 [Anaerolineaceae bacterium]|nr:hypothetical protein [Anaerolineaceae bacterium]